MEIKQTAYSTIFQLLVMTGNFLYGILMAKYFGASAEMDSYMVVSSVIIFATTIIMNFQSKALIPYAAGKENHKEIVDTIFRFNIVVLTIILSIVFIFSFQIVYAMAPGLEIWQIKIGARLMKISIFYVFFSNFMGFGNAIMQYHFKTVETQAISFLRVVALILFLYFTHDILKIYSLASAYLASVVVITPMFIIFLQKKGYKLFSPFKIWNSDVKKYLILILPIFTGKVLIWGIRLADSFLASYLPVGSLSHITYSLRIVTIVSTLFTGISVVYFPLMVKFKEQRDNIKFMKVVKEGFEIIFFASLFITTFIFLCSEDLIQIVFERGEFTHADTLEVAKLLKFYSIMLLVAPLGEILSNVYFSRGNTKLPTYFSMTSSIVNIVLNFLLVIKFGVYGLAVASSISFLLGTLLQLRFIDRVNSNFRITDFLLIILRTSSVIAIAILPAFIIKTLTFNHSILLRLTEIGSTYFFLTIGLSYLFKFNLVKTIIEKIVN